MDSFERAHVPRKSSFKMQNKPDDAMKRQLKEMMNAFKKGNNQDILKSSEFKPKFDQDETISLSDISEFSATTKNVVDSIETASSASDDLPSTSVDNNSSKPDSLDGDRYAIGDTSEDVTDCCEGFKTLSTSMDDSVSTSFGNTSDAFESVGSTDSSELSIMSSLRSSGSSTDVSEDTFDADGTLASKILEKLSRKDKTCNKRKDFEEIQRNSEIQQINKHENKIKEKPVGRINKTKKVKQETQNNSTAYFLEEDFSSDLDKATNQNICELKKEVTKETKKEKNQTHKQSHSIIELSDDDHINSSMDSVSTSLSSPFISVSAENMSSQSLGDIVGDYIHPTIRNLPTEKQSILRNTISMFNSEAMVLKDIDDEISSLIPEVDEELAVEDLNLDTDTQELIDESNTINNDISPTEDMFESNIEDITAETTIDHSMIEESIEEIPMTLYYGKDKYILVMNHQSELYIHGKLQIADINGMVEIFGYKLNYNCIEVYAPYCNFTQRLKVLDNPHEINPDLYSELVSAGLTAFDADKIVSTIEKHSAVIILSKLDSRTIDFVDNSYSPVDLFSKRTDNTPSFLKRAAESLGCSFYLKPPKRWFEEKAVWNEVYKNDRDGSRGIVCGGKGTGKSTFLRHYVNTLLAEGPVLVIDLDPGQAEFTIPGNISATTVESPLIGPNYTHLKTPEKMLNIGIINTMDNARRYLSAVRELIAYCRANEEFRELPWIVNTMGLCNNMGLKFMVSIILQIHPTFLLQLDSKIAKRRFGVDLDPQTVTSLYEQKFSKDKAFGNIQNTYLKYSFVIAGQEETALKGNTFGSSMQPRDERYLNILAYFGELINDRKARSLMEIVPYEVHLRDLNIGLNVRIPWDMVARVINGKIIALCQQNTSCRGKVFTLGDKALLCHGHGLIRGIDFEQGLLYIITPIPTSKLNLVDTLVYSDWMPELRGQVEDLPCGTAIPYRTATNAQHHRQLMFPPQRRFNPLQLLRMTRSS